MRFVYYLESYTFAAIEVEWLFRVFGSYIDVAYETSISLKEA